MLRRIDRGAGAGAVNVLIWLAVAYANREGLFFD